MKIKNNFIKSILTLMAGSSVAQLLPVLIMPVLTRVYGAEELGVLANYLALVAILSIFLTLRLDMAVVLLQKENHAISLVKLCIKIALVLACVMLSFLVSYRFFIEFYQFSFESWWFLVPISAFLTACYAVLLAWLNRKKDYRGMSTSRVVQSGSISFLQMIACLFPLGSGGLIIADILGRAFAVIVLLKKKISICLFNLERKSKKQLVLLRKYSHFPRYEMPASLLNISAHQLPFVALPMLFSTTVTGMYFLVFRVMLLPSSLIGSAVTEVFRMHAIEDIKQTGNCQKLFIETAKLLFILAITPFLFIIFFAPWFFSFVFGEQWYIAGEYARILAPLALLQFVSSPLSCILIVREKLQLDMILQGIFLCCVILSLFLGWYSKSLIGLMVLLSASGCLFYIGQIVGAYYHSQAYRAIGG